MGKVGPGIVCDCVEIHMIIQNSGILRTCHIFRIVSSIFDGAFYSELCIAMAYFNFYPMEMSTTIRN